METRDLMAVLPLLVLAAASIVVLLAVAFRRDHRLAFFLTLAGITISFLSISAASPSAGRQVTVLLIVDRYALFYTGLVLVSGFAVALLSYDYLKRRVERAEEYYLLLLLALLGASVLVSAGHFASFFLGLEILSISLYALIAYGRGRIDAEAGIKYLIPAAASSAFLLFGMALLYGELGTLNFSLLAAKISQYSEHRANVLAGMALIIVGFGFKLALVPFHLWTPDVYEGAPAPVTAFIATVSKGAVFALLLRYFMASGVLEDRAMVIVFTVIAAASMLAGNLLALFQDNMKRLLAYSSIAHLGYLLVAFLASGELRITAVTFYLAAYFVTTLGAFGVVTVLSGKARDADRLSDYAGLFSRHPWTAGIFTAMLLSLAGIPLTAGFIGKFYLTAAGVGSALWFLVVLLVVNSAIGLFYYLRVLVVMYSHSAAPGESVYPRATPAGGLVLAALVLLLVWLGIYPGPLITVIQTLAVGP